MLAYFTQALGLKIHAQQCFDEALTHTVVARDAQPDQNPCIGAATDVFVSYLQRGPDHKKLTRGALLLERADSARPLPLCAQGVRASLRAALEQSSPSFRAALVFVRAAHDQDWAADQLLGAQTRHRHISLQAHVQELLLVWQDRMLDERAALRYAQAVPEAALQTLAGPAGRPYIALARIRRRYGAALRQPADAVLRYRPPLNCQQHKRLQDIDYGLRLCALPPLPEALMRPKPVGNNALDVRQAQYRILELCQDIDLALLRGLFQTRQLARFAQQSGALGLARQHDIARAVREAQLQLGPHTIEAQLGAPRQISSATFSANASMSTGLRR